MRLLKENLSYNEFNNYCYNISLKLYQIKNTYSVYQSDNDHKLKAYGTTRLYERTYYAYGKRGGLKGSITIAFEESFENEEYSYSIYQYENNFDDSFQLESEV